MRFSLFAVALMTGTLFWTISVSAAAPNSKSSSAQKFVQAFYTWYMQANNQNHNLSQVEFALETKPELFSKAIISGLHEDETAQAKSPGYIVGIDFDPFVNAQDTCEPYKIGEVTHVGTTYRVEVFGQGSCEHRKEPDVIAAIKEVNGSWVFADFYYPGQGDLFSALETARKERKKSKK